MSISSWLQKIEFFAPLVLQFIPGVPPELTSFIVKGIQAAETIPGASGTTKLTAAVAIANAGVAAINTVKPGAIDAEQVNSAIVNGINTAIAVTNLVHKQPQPAA